MTSRDCLDALKKSGTGESKMIYARQLLESNPAATADELCQALRKGGCSDGTFEKVERLLGVKLDAAGDAEPRARFPVRAPAGGCRLRNIEYGPGVFIPQEVIDTATPAEIAILCQASTGLKIQSASEPGGAHDRGSSREIEKVKEEAEKRISEQGRELYQLRNQIKSQEQSIFEANAAVALKDKTIADLQAAVDLQTEADAAAKKKAETPKPTGK